MKNEKREKKNRKYQKLIIKKILVCTHSFVLYIRESSNDPVHEAHIVATEDDEGDNEKKKY